VSPGCRDEESVSRMSVPLEMIFAATVAFGDPILGFEVSVGDSLRIKPSNRNLLHLL
jgi:hypothetical protein